MQQYCRNKLDRTQQSTVIRPSLYMPNSVIKKHSSIVSDGPLTNNSWNREPTIDCLKTLHWHRK